jgi:polysaccharide biosynthesis protein PslG
LVRRRLTPVAAVLACLLALGAAPAADARPARDIGGVALHPWQLQNPRDRERVFAGVAATGVRTVRVDFPWVLVESNENHHAWGQLDAIVAAADRHGLELLPMVAYVPAWANGSGELWAFPDSDAFEDFFATALRRYPQIRAWEIWNEPNFERFSKPRPDPAGFVELLRAARRARDSVGSRAKLIAGGLAPAGDIGVIPWINEVAIRGGLALIDGLGIHPYSSVSPDDPRSWMMQLQALHDRLADMGRPDLPLWLTEYGAPSVPVANGYGPALTEAQQADRLAKAFALATRFDWIENLTWYEYRDSCGDRRDAECNFGLVRGDLSPKPAYTALRGVMTGAITPLRPTLLLSTKIRGARVPVAKASKAKRKPRAKRRAAKRRAAKRRVKHIRVNRITVSGRLTLPGTPYPNAKLTMLLPRRGGQTKTVQVQVAEGYFWARFDGRDLTSGTLEARFPGAPGYQPLTTQIQVISSVTTSR